MGIAHSFFSTWGCIRRQVVFDPFEGITLPLVIMGLAGSSSSLLKDGMTFPSCFLGHGLPLLLFGCSFACGFDLLWKSVGHHFFIQVELGIRRSVTRFRWMAWCRLVSPSPLLGKTLSIGGWWTTLLHSRGSKAFLRASCKKFLRINHMEYHALFEFANGHLHADHAHCSLSSLVKTLD